MHPNRPKSTLTHKDDIRHRHRTSDAADDHAHDDDDDGLLVASPTRLRHDHGVRIDPRLRLSIYVDPMAPFESGTLPDADVHGALAIVDYYIQHRPMRLEPRAQW